jgi:hypothetical protein
VELRVLLVLVVAVVAVVAPSRCRVVRIRSSSRVAVVAVATK